MPIVAFRSLVLAIVAVSVTASGAAAGSSKSFNITNSCSYTVWPAISSGPGSAAPDTTGFELAPGQWQIVAVPSGWSGRLWGRTLCSTDSSGRFTCVTGDCGSAKIDCAGGNAAPPATLAQFTLDNGMDTYAVSLVDGFNLPLLVSPQGAAETPDGNCASTGCVADLNAACPAELRVTSAGAGACKSACLAFGSPKDCCTGAVACKNACTGGEHGTPSTCNPSSYSGLFEKACPRAYGAGSTVTCAAGGDTYYRITFCPTTTSAKYSMNPRSEAPETTVTANLPPLINGGSTTPHTGGGSQVGGAAASVQPWRVTLAVAILGVVGAVLSLVANWLGLLKAICSR